MSATLSESDPLPRTYSPTAWIAGAIVPVVVLVGGYLHLRQPPELTGQASQFETRLEAAAEAEVLVLGSSLANRGIDPEALARELRIDAGNVVMMQLPHSSTAHWYAMLKNRVYANGYGPKLVLVVDALTAMLNHDLLEQQPNIERLVAQMTDDEPVLAAKVFGYDDPTRFRAVFMRERASRYRQDLLESWRTSVVTALFSRKWQEEEGRRLVEKVNEEVFANDAMDYSLHVEGATGIATFGEVPSTERGDFDLRRDALLGDMAELTRGHSTALVYVRYPFPPSNREMDVVPDDIEADALAWMEEVGSGYLDMRTLDLDETFYEDMRHMTKEGAERFSATIGRSLMGMEALKGHDNVRVVRGLSGPSEVRLVGDRQRLPDPGRISWSEDGCRASLPAPALAGFQRERMTGIGDVALPFEVLESGEALDDQTWGSGCVGAWRVVDGELLIAPRAMRSSELEIRWVDATAQLAGVAREPLWIAGGQRLDLAFDEPWKLDERSFRVLLRGQSLGGDGSIEVTIDEASFEIFGQDGRLSGNAALPAPREPWTLSIAVPPDAPWVRLHNLAIGVPPATSQVIGTEETLHGASIRVVGGRSEDTHTRPRFASAPPPFPTQPKVRKGAREMGLLSMPKYAELADAVESDSARPNRCTPVQVLDEGVPLPLPHSVCYDVMTKGAGRSCFAAEQFFFAPADGTDPTRNGRTYEVRLDPGRVCETWSQKKATTLRDSFWLYPGDVLTLDVPARRTEAFDNGANVLEVEVVPHLYEADVPLEVTVTSAAGKALEASWTPAGRLKRRSSRFELDPPLPALPGPVSIRLHNPSDKTFHLVTLVSLLEDDGHTEEESRSRVRRNRTYLDGVEIHREGEATPLPPVKRVGVIAQGGYEVKMFTVWPISDTALDKQRLPMLSPVRMSANGLELQRRLDRSPVRNGCELCFSHMGQALVVGVPGPESAEFKVWLDPELPLRNEAGESAWWMYPGTDVVFDVPEPWQGEEALLTVVARAFHAKRDAAGAGLRLVVDGVIKSFDRVGQGTDTSGRADLRLTQRPDGPWSFRVRTEQEGEFALIEEVRLQDDRGRVYILPLPETEPVEEP